MAKVIWSPSALKHLNAIGDYIAEDSPKRAIDFCSRLLASTAQLESFSMSGPICPEDSSCRQLVIEGYRIFYEISASSVHILAIVSPGQNPQGRLFSIKK